MSALNNTKKCPFCKESNRCNANVDLLCWCSKVKIPNALIDLLAQDDKRKSCICLACITAYNHDSINFMANIRRVQ